MKAITADPREIRKIFSDVYVIPDFQRPYSWETEQCDKLWEDILDFFTLKTTTDDAFFLGNLVVHPEEGKYVVIDGQQRLTTLMLLIKALHLKAGTVHALEKCLKIEDPLTSELTETLRVESKVLAEDKANLSKIVFNNGVGCSECKLKVNYDHISEKISEWWASKGNSAEQLNRLILAILDDVVLLPIHCATQDDALTIFETINNRGMPLSDADIFKAKLYKLSTDRGDEFIAKWNALAKPNSAENHKWLFRIHMHVQRALNNDTGKEVGLRAYFDKNKFTADWVPVLNSLKLYYDVDNNWNCPPEIDAWWRILYTYPNYYWQFPLFVFLHKFGEYNADDEFDIPEGKREEFLTLIIETAKYFFIKGVVFNTVSAVRDGVFKVCSLIEANGNYLAEYKNGIEIEEFERKISEFKYGRYLRGLVFIGAYLNPAQDKADFDSVISNCHIEHILPKKWNNYDQWTEATWKDNIDQLGNLVPLEWRLNISARNEFFGRKKRDYTRSNIQDAVDLISLPDWHPTEFRDRHKEIIRRIFEFFRN